VSRLLLDTHAFLWFVATSALVEAAAWRQQPFQEAWAVALNEGAKADWVSRQKPGEGICQVRGLWTRHDPLLGGVC
jgi:hypothetical protein